MGGNLAKAPVVGIFYAALVYYLAAFLPRGEAYAASLAEFSLPLFGLLMLLACAVVPAVIYALVFSSAKKGGVGLLIPLVFAACGLQFAAPAFRQLLLGEATGTMTLRDTLFVLLGKCVATILALVLSMLLFKTAAEPARAPGAPPPPEQKYKLSILGIIIRMLVLPVIFTVAYYLLWYHLCWKADAVREFYASPELEPFMKTIIDILVSHGKEVLVTLLNGLVYAAFSLLLLFKMQGKRVLYIVVNTLFCLTGAIAYLVPDPIMPVAVQRAHLFETGALLLVYGALSAVLLYTAFRRVDAAPAPGKTVPQAAPAQAKGAAPKPAAAAAKAAK